MPALALLTGDAESFVHKVWAARPHVHQTNPADLAGLLGLDDVDHLLTSTALRTPALRLARDGKVIATNRYTRSATLAGAPLTGLVDARKVFDLFADGATVVLQGLHRYWPSIGQLVGELELELGHPCQANAYLTPPGAQGFALHSDTHHVFVLQTYGRKLWEVHDGEDRRQMLLERGTSLYLPSGTPHAASTQESASLHVTLGVNQVTWRQLLDRVTRGLLAADELDRSAPAGYLADPDALAAGLRDRLTALADSLAAVDVAQVAQDQVAHFLTSRRPTQRGGLSDRLALAEIDDETVLVRRPGSVCVLRPDGDRLRVLLGDRELRVPSSLAAVMDQVVARPRLHPADLAGWLDPHSRLVLARRLVREGLLQVQG